MLRVRGFTQDDSHIFCTRDMLTAEVMGVLDLMELMMKTFGYTYKAYLATRPAKSLGTEEEWSWSTNALKAALEQRGTPYEIDEGGGVFYAPKIDIKLIDSMGREWQGPTTQVDLNLPKRFSVTYVGEDNTEHETVIVHRTVLGSMERFIGGLLEHYAGAFPVWLAPVQSVVAPVSEKNLTYAQSVFERLRQEDIRVELDDRNEKIGYKIREAEKSKIPYMIVVGKNEEEQKSIALRKRRAGDLGQKSLEEFVTTIKNDINHKTIF
jgi:threonyl-tRNA synthetase